jgi:tetraacyldisaccharide 4'-kinase
MNSQKFIENNLYKRSLLSYLLWLVSLKYSWLLRLRRKVYQKNPKLSYRSTVTIISVGNIVSGGSGKTPFTIFLAKNLAGKGFKVAVSHRGYKGKFENENKLISNREEVHYFARDAGDEAYLLAQKLKGIPIITGKNRRLSVRILEKKYPDLDYIILDDSFQHLTVKHDIDFVLFNEVGGLGNGFVLPAGILRESLFALKFADYIVWNGNGEIHKKLIETGKSIIKCKYKISRFYDSNGRDVQISKDKSYALLSGIGIPKSFEKTIYETGINFTKHFTFSDHFSYEDLRELQRIRIEMETMQLDYLITTEKDFAKLVNIQHALPIIVAEAELIVENIEVLEMKK